jgi:hypothetical protein
MTAHKPASGGSLPDWWTVTDSDAVFTPDALPSWPNLQGPRGIFDFPDPPMYEAPPGNAHHRFPILSVRSSSNKYESWGIADYDILLTGSQQDGATGERTASLYLTERRTFNDPHDVFAFVILDCYGGFSGYNEDEFTPLLNQTELDVYPNPGIAHYGFPEGNAWIIYDDYDGTTPRYQFTKQGGVYKFGIFDKAATPVVQQTGVPVTAAGIHAALVALGWITA